MGQVALPLLAATLVALLMANVVVALRWHLILLTEAPSPGPAVLLKIVLVGLFFNQVLPTGVGGDAVRVWRCSKVGIGLVAALRSILLDRACGYMVLIVVYAAIRTKYPQARSRRILLSAAPKPMPTLEQRQTRTASPPTPVGSS